MPLPADLQNFDIANAGVHVWLFKKSGGAQGAAPNYNGRWIGTTEAVDEALKVAVASQRDRIEEVMPYSLLAQNNEASALSIASLETNAPVILQKTETPVQAKAVRAIRDIQNTAFYAVRFVSDGVPLLAVRKTDTSWRTKKRRNMIDVVFDNEGLALDQKPAFSLSAYVDFFVFQDQVFVLDKTKFESVLHYRAAHEGDFATLQAQPEFSGLFSNLGPIIDYVGTNKIQLRRASAIRQKAHFADAGFMQRLKDGYQDVGLTINFDEEGLIVPCADTCPDIFQALLDHRLTSSFSENNYDVQDATPVA